MQSNSNKPIEPIEMKHAAESDEDEFPPGAKRSHQDTSSASPSCINNTNIHDFLRYSFALPMLSAYMSDADVLIGLLPTMNASKQSLLRGYSVKQVLSCYLGFEWLERISCYKQLQLTVSNIYDVPCWPVLMKASLYEKLSSIAFHNDFNEPLQPGAWPSNLKSLRFGMGFDHPISAGILPASLKSLVFGRCFNKPIEPGVLPFGLESIEFGPQYTQSLVAGAIPMSIKGIIYLGFSSSAFLNELIFPAVESLSLLHCNMPPNFVSSFPNITCLKVCFNESDKFGPNALRFPPSLKHLDLLGYAEPITHAMLPDQLEYLNLGDLIYSLPPGVLPASLKVLMCSVEHLEQGSLPSQLEVFEARRYRGIYVLPSSLRTFKMDHHEHQLQPGDLPQSLTELSLRIFDRPVLPGAIPNSVKKLKLTILSRVLPGLIPTSVTNLALMVHVSPGKQLSDYLAPNVIPSSATHLEVNTHPADIPVFDMVPIPSSVTHLKLAGALVSPLVAGEIPTSVTHIAFGSKFDQKISVQSLLTNHLQYLELSSKYRHFSELEVPSTLTVCIPDYMANMVTALIFQQHAPNICIKGAIRIMKRSLCW